MHLYVLCTVLCFKEGRECQESKTQTGEDKQWWRNQGCRSLIKALPISSLYPFLYFLIAKREEDIGYYAGYVDIETCINSPGNYSCQCPKGYKHEGMDEKSCIKDKKRSKGHSPHYFIRSKKEVQFIKDQGLDY